MTKKQVLVWMAWFPCLLLAQEEGGRTIILSEEPEKSVKSRDTERVMAAVPSDGQVVVVAGGSVLDAAHAVVAQVPGRVLSQDLLDEAEAAAVRATNNLFTTGGKTIAWQKALNEVLRPVALRYFDDGAVVKIGSKEKVAVMYAALEQDRLAGNHSRIEVNFAGGTPISAALRVIQRLGGINMNFDYMKAEHRGVVATVAPAGADTDGQTVTVQAAPPEAQTTYATPEGQEVEWRAVLKEVLDPIGYTFIEDNGTVKPMPVEQLTKFNQAKINAKPLVTKIIRVHYANAEMIVEKLGKMSLLKHEKAFMEVNYGKEGKDKNDNAKIYKGTSGGRLESGSSGDKVGLSTSGSGAAVFDQLTRPRTPQGIVVVDVEENLAEIERQVKLLDTRDRQVLIEALILELSDEMKTEMGVKWGDLGVRYNSQYPYGSPQPNNPYINLDDWSGKIAKNRFGVTPISFDAVIKMIEGDKFSRSLGSPIITVGDRGEAIIQIATIIPIEQTTVNYIGTDTPQTAEATEWLSLQVGTTLWVSPEISENGDFVRLSVHPQITSADQDDPVVSSTDQINYVVESQELDTRVNVPSGEVLLLGGLTKSQKGEIVSKVPWLGDIPFIGRLFSSKTAVRKQRHLVILIRPTVLNEDAPNTGFEGPSMKVADPLMEGVGKTIPPNKGEDPLVAKEKAYLDKKGWFTQAKGEEPVVVDVPASLPVEPPAAPVNHGSTEVEAGK